MSESNIIVGSNVYMCRTDNPIWDPEFVKQVQDYSMIKYISGRRQVDNRVASLVGNQGAILKTEMRCVYAPKDPCWGYKNSKKRVVSACINGDCPKIYECNPEYKKEDSVFWVTTGDERDLYKDPDKQTKYYFVDMISDEEMSRYVSDPGNAGINHRTPPAPVIPPPPPKEDTSTRIDPKTGRKMVIIGYKKLPYPEEDGLPEPIWGFVDEVEAEEKQTVIRRAKKIEKKEPKREKRVLQKAPEKTIDPDFVHKTEYEKAVIDHVVDEVRLTEYTADYIVPGSTVILLDNPAEVAFVSSTLLVSGINHSILDKADVVLALVDDYGKYTSYEYVMISSTAVKTGCKEENVQAWKQLAQRENLVGLEIADRDFYQFSYGEETRWTCRNMYGITHVCVLDSDIQEIESISDGLYPVSIVDDRDCFMMCKKDGSLVGRLGKAFVDLIDAMKKSGDIASSPANIKGVSLKITNGKAEILGMGHLKFIEY